MSSLRINYVLNHYSPTATTHFAHVLNLLREMHSRGCMINLFIEKAPSGGPAVEGIRVVLLRFQMPVLRHLELMLRLGIAILQGYRSTFIRISAPAAIAASLSHMLLGGRAFLWQSGATHEFDRSRPASLDKLKWWLGSALPNRLARSLCQRFVTGPEAMVEYYARVVGVERKKIRLLYNDIDLSRWRAVESISATSAFEARFDVAKPSRVLLLVHRLSPVRRTLMYLEPLLTELEAAFGADWALLVAGDGSERADAEHLASAKGVKGCCFFLGAVPNEELPAIYRLADVFINPSHAEGFPRVLIEAMACRLPIVTTDAGGTMDLVGSDQAKWVVDRKEPQTFAKRVMELLADRNEMLRLSSENAVTVESFSTVRVAGMYCDVLGER